MSRLRRQWRSTVTEFENIREQLQMYCPSRIRESMKVLQPGSSALRQFFRVNDLAKSFRKLKALALREIRRERAILRRQGQKRDSADSVVP